jgi:RNA 2',3'-cyclic 3'-phosphodiesterase
MRCFTSIDLPQSVTGLISELQSKIQHDNVVPVKEEAMHITLHFFENIKESQSSAVEEAIRSIGIGKFSVKVKGLSHFGGDRMRILFANIEDTEGKVFLLQKEVGEVLSILGVDYDQKEKFIPHITIARCRGDSSWLKGFIDLHSGVEFGSFTIDRILFKKSELSPNGPVYTNLFEHKI